MADLVAFNKDKEVAAAWFDAMTSVCAALAGVQVRKLAVASAFLWIFCSQRQVVRGTGTSRALLFLFAPGN